MTTEGRNADGSYTYPIGSGYVGTSILDVVSSAMYSNALDVLREYIQNAVDGGASEVKISVRPHDIVIRDNGVGMGPDQLDDARKIAISRKGSGDVGFRGIGIYSSFSICDTLEVISRPEGTDQAFILRVDYAGMRREIERARTGTAAPLPLLVALERYTRISDYQDALPSEEAGPFTLVRLISPTQRFRNRLNNVPEVEYYLHSAVPLEFPDTFAPAAKIREELEKHGVPLRLISVSLKPGNKKHAIGIRQPDVPNVLRPIIREVKDGNRTIAVLWLCINRERKVLKPDEVQGFQIRFKGFGIGDRRLPETLWPGLGSGVLYRHLMGEIHVLDPTLSPTAERTNFEDTHARDILFRLLKTEFGDLQQLIGDRRDALADISHGDKKKEHAWRIEQGIRNLERVRERFRLDPPLTFEEALDTPGQKIVAKHNSASAASTDTPAQGQAPSQPSDATTKKGQLGAASSSGASSGEGSDGRRSNNGDVEPETTAAGNGSGEEEPAPMISDTLLNLDIRWPKEGREIFEMIDNALAEVIPRIQVEACRLALRDMIERRYTYQEEFD
jgi:hypothetical protein